MFLRFSLCARGLSRGVVLFLLLREILPFSPTVEVDKCLHAAPFTYLSFEPWEADRLMLKLAGAISQEGRTLFANSRKMTKGKLS